MLRESETPRCTLLNARQATQNIHDFPFHCTGWAVHQILMCEKKERARVITQVVDLAHKCLELSNFHV
jgi:hypothetical protein